MSTRSAKLGGSSGAVLAYLEDASRTLDYYTDDPALSEVWAKGAAHLGIEKGLTRAQWCELFEGRWDGRQLSRAGHHKTVDPKTGEEVESAYRVGMIDTVYGWDKSVSVAMIAGADADRRAIADAALGAAKAGHEALEAHAPVMRPRVKVAVGGGEAATTRPRVPGELIATPVVQFTARPTDTSIVRGVADPHLHVHVPYFTLGFVPDPDHPNGHRPLALDEYGLKNRRCVEERDAASQGEMARRLEAMGYELEYNDWDRARGGRVSWRIKGIDESVCAHYSTNHTRALQIARRWEAQYGRPITDAELTDQLRITRRAKSPDDKAQDLRPHWDRYRADLDANGLGAPAPVRHDHPTGWATKPLAERLGALEERLYSPQGLCRDGPVFATEDIAPAVQRAAVGLHLTQDEIRTYEAQLRRELVPIRTANDTRFSYWTTTAMLMAEESIAQTIDDKAASRAIHISRESIEAAIANQTVALDPEQRQAVLDICKGSLWTFVEAPAGAGKTTMLATVVDAYRSEKNLDRVIVVSTSAATAERSGQKIGADKWGSVESICARIEAGRLGVTRRSLVIVDEAAMMDTPRIAALLDHIGKAQVVCVGDPVQLTPIGAGGWYQGARERHAASELTRVHRHVDRADVRAYAAIRAGRAPEALADLAARDRVHVCETRADKVAEVVSAYRGLRERFPAESVRMVIDGPNTDVDEANRFAQAVSRARGGH